MIVHLATACAPNLFESPIYLSVFPAAKFFFLAGINAKLSRRRTRRGRRI